MIDGGGEEGRKACHGVDSKAFATGRHWESGAHIRIDPLVFEISLVATVFIKNIPAVLEEALLRSATDSRQLEEAVSKIRVANGEFSQRFGAVHRDVIDTSL